MRIDTIATFQRAAALGFNGNREDMTDMNKIPVLSSTTKDMTVSTNCQFQTSPNGRCQDGITLIGTGQVKAFFSLCAPAFSSKHLAKQLFLDTLQARKEFSRRFSGLICG